MLNNITEYQKQHTYSNKKKEEEEEEAAATKVRK